MLTPVSDSESKRYSLSMDEGSYHRKYEEDEDEEYR